jgi:hypothetical protein
VVIGVPLVVLDLPLPEDVVIGMPLVVLDLPLPEDVVIGISLVVLNLLLAGGRGDWDSAGGTQSASGRRP